MNLKSFGIISFVIIIGGLLTVNGYFSGAATATVEPCQQPLTYQFGDIDPRFDITKDKLIQIMKEVETVWATAMDQPLLEYKKNGKVVIHLIYGEEQQRTEAEQLLTKKIQIKKDQIAILEEEYEHLSSNFQQKRKVFQDILSEYNKQAREYSELAKKWKGKGVTAQTYKRLEEMEEKVKQLRSVVERKRDNLETLRQKTNAKSAQLNRLINIQNEMITEYNKRFGVAKKFNQGRYIKKGDSERINIFQFSNLAQLKTVLAHEAGHALGLDHVHRTPKSIMFPIMGDQNIFDLSLTDEDIAAIKNRCNN